MIDYWGIACNMAIRWMSLYLTDDKSILVQVMAWCRQATSHYLSRCWPRSLLPYGVTRPQWVNILTGYPQTSNISRTLEGNKIVDHSNVCGATPDSDPPTTSSFWTEHLVSIDWAKATARRDEKHLSFGIWWDHNPPVRAITGLAGQNHELAH